MVHIEKKNGDMKLGFQRYYGLLVSNPAKLPKPVMVENMQ